MSVGLPPIASADAPAAPGIWPLPPGWWLVSILVFVVAAWGMYLVRKRHLIQRRRRLPVSRPATRALALAALDELQARQPMSDRQAAYRVNEILRAALFVSGPTDEWVCFSPRADVVPEQAEWEAFWEELAMRYRQPDEVCDEQRQARWFRLSRAWIEQLPEYEATEDTPWT